MAITGEDCLGFDVFTYASGNVVLFGGCQSSQYGFAIKFDATGVQTDINFYQDTHEGIVVLKDEADPTEFALAATNSDKDTVYFFILKASDLTISEFHILIQDASNDPSAKYIEFGSLFIDRVPGEDNVYYVGFTSRWNYVMIMEIDRSATSSSNLPQKLFISTVSNNYDGLYQMFVDVDGGDYDLYPSSVLGGVFMFGEYAYNDGKVLDCFITVSNAMPADLIFDVDSLDWKICLNMKTLSSSITHKFQGSSAILMKGNQSSVSWKKNVATSGDNVFCSVVFEDDSANLHFLLLSDTSGTYQYQPTLITVSSSGASVTQKVWPFSLTDEANFIPYKAMYTSGYFYIAATALQLSGNTYANKRAVVITETLSADSLISATVYTVTTST